MSIDQFIAEVAVEHCRRVHAYVVDPTFARIYSEIIYIVETDPGKRKRGRPKGLELTEGMLSLALLHTHLTTRKYAKQLVGDTNAKNAKREEIKRARLALSGIENRIEGIAEIKITRFARRWKIPPDIVAFALDGAGNPRKYEDLVRLIKGQLESAEQRLREITDPHAPQP